MNGSTNKYLNSLDIFDTIALACVNYGIFGASSLEACAHVKIINDSDISLSLQLIFPSTELLLRNYHEPRGMVVFYGFLITLLLPNVVF